MNSWERMDTYCTHGMYLNTPYMVIIPHTDPLSNCQLVCWCGFLEHDILLQFAIWEVSGEKTYSPFNISKHSINFRKNGRYHNSLHFWQFVSSNKEVTLKTLHIPAVIFTSQLGLEKWKLDISDKIVIYSAEIFNVFYHSLISIYMHGYFWGIRDR